MEEEKFTVAEFKKYVESCDSFGDVHHFLNAKNIRKANEPKEEEDNTDDTDNE